MKVHLIPLGIALSLAFTMIQTTGSSLAQPTDSEAYRNEIERARAIIIRYRNGRIPTQEELDILDDVLSRAGRTAASEADAAKKPNSTISSAPPGTTSEASPEKHGAKPLQVNPGLSFFSLPGGKVYMYVVDLNASYLRTFWLDQRRQPYRSIAKLEEDQSRAGYRLKFAINGGIFDDQYRPKGLYIEEGKLLSPLDTAQPGGKYGNFYMEPNGVFIIDNQRNARILTTPDFIKQFQGRASDSIRLAVQSGPILLLHNEINKEFTQDSGNRTRRSGVGVLDERRVVFAMAAGEINFRDFATLFEKIGCSDALFFDGGPIPSMYVENQVALESASELVTLLGVTEKQ